MGELVNIVWPAHMKALCDGLWGLFQKKYKTDFMLSLSNGSGDVTVHQLMLAIFCPSIRNSEDSRFVLKLEQLEVKEEDIHMLVEFMYLGKIKVAKDRLPILQNIAEILGLRVLAKVIKNFIKKAKSAPDGSGEIQHPESLKRKISTSYEVKSKTEDRSKDKRNKFIGDTKDLYLSLEGFVDRDDGNGNEEEEEEAEVNSDISDWEADRIKEKRRKILNSRRAVNRAKKASRVRLTASKIVSRNSGSFVKYNVDKYYDPLRDGLVCKICDKVLKYKSTYVRHIRCHENPELYSRCTYCDYKSDTKNALVQHLAAKHKVDTEGKQLEKSIKCNQCSYTCVLDFQLKNHMYVKHSKRGNICNICGYSCKSRAVYEVHLQAVHGNNERPFMCETCGFRAKTLGVLRNHLKTHKDKKTCDVCGVWLTYHSYKAHMKLHTTTERPFPCHLCSFAARKKYNLKVHLKNVHKLEEESGYASLNQRAEEEQSIDMDKGTVTAVVINDVGEQLIEISQQEVMEATFHMEIS